MENYRAAFKSQIIQYGVSKDAICLSTLWLADFTKDLRSKDNIEQDLPVKMIAKPHEELRADAEEAISLCNTTPGSLILLILARRHIQAYSAFKGVADRVIGMQSLCMTEEKLSQKQRRQKPRTIHGQRHDEGRPQMKGRNHTVADGSTVEGRIYKSLKFDAPKRSTMILGADINGYPDPSSDCSKVLIDLGDASWRRLADRMPIHCCTCWFNGFRWRSIPRFDAFAEQEQERAEPQQFETYNAKSY